jgi:hypothetical protein
MWQDNLNAFRRKVTKIVKDFRDFWKVSLKRLDDHQKGENIWYHNSFAAYGKEGDRYKILVKFAYGLFDMPPMPLYAGKRKPLFKHLGVIAALAWLFQIPIALVIFMIVVPIYCYLDGIRNFVTDSGWQDNVRIFVWMNMAFVVALFVLLLLILIK